MSQPSTGRKSSESNNPPSDKTPSEVNEIDTIDKNLEENDEPLLLIAVLFKEAALDSPTFRSSINHLSIQFDKVESWLEAFVGSLQQLSREMEGKFFFSLLNRLSIIFYVKR
jgi:hypothetical protein